MLQRVKLPQTGIELRRNPVCSLRHKRSKKRGSHDDPLCQVVHHGCKAVLLRLVLCQNPRLRLIDILVQSLEYSKNLLQRIGHPKLCHILFHLGVSARHHCLQLLIDRLICAAVLHNAVKVLVAHGDGSLYKISKCIGKIRIDALHAQLPGNDAIVLIRHLVKNKITDRIHTEQIGHVIRINDISLRLGHLLSALEKPWMSEDLFRQGLPQCHQENRPVNRVETDDILSDQMKIRRPVLLIQVRGVAVSIVTDPCDIVAQCIEPHIYDMIRIKIHRNAPFEAGAGNAQILKARKKEVVHHLVLAGLRLNELRMRIDMIDQALCILLHAEEIRILILLMHGSAADRALVAVHNLRSSVKCLALRAVHALIRAQINISLIIKLFENLLNLSLMILIRRADEAVIGGIHLIPDSLDFSCRFINKLLRRLAGLCCSFLNFLTMLIRTGLEINIITVCTLIAGNAVRHDNLIGIADMRLARGISDGSCNIIRSLVLHCVLLAYLISTRSECHIRPL